MEHVNGVVIGVGAPNRAKDGRSVQCAIVLCRTKGLCRIFGDFENEMKRLRLWDIVDCSVRVHGGDNRQESWRVNHLSHAGSLDSRDSRAAVLDSCCFDCESDPIDKLNRERRSIGVVKIDSKSLGYRMEPRDAGQQVDWIMAQRESPRKPYISWASAAGKQHCNQLCAHEAYEFVRKNKNATARLWENMRIEDDLYQKWLLIGNTKDHRNVWVVVHVHRLKKNFNENLGASFCLGETTDSWPYLPAEELREKRATADGQKMLFSH